MSDHTEMHRRFHAHGVQVDLGQGGLARVCVPGDHAAELYLHGAHLTHWQPAGHQRVLWLSGASRFADGVAIRGGIPLCLPWFGALPQHPELPMHGLARLRSWILEEVERLADGRVRLRLSLDADERSRAWWPHGFHAEYQVIIGKHLELELAFTNPGAEPVTFSEALHTYLAVGDVRRCLVHGLAEADYLDKTRQFAKAHESRSLLSFAGETDRMYLTDRSPCTIDDPTWGRRIVIEKEGSGATVVWNPWRERASSMRDIDPEGWQRFLCVESANIAERPVQVAPGETHRLRTRIHVHPL